MASAAIPMLVGTGISLLGAKAGWDPRLTALASMAGGGIAGGMASGAFGSAAGGVGAGMSTGQLAHSVYNPATMGAAATSAAPYNAALSGWTPSSYGGFGNWIKGPQGKALGADMLKTFLDYEIALANQPPQRLSSGGGGGGGGGRAPAYPGGGQTGQKSVVWSYPQATGMYQPKPLA